MRSDIELQRVALIARDFALGLMVGLCSLTASAALCAAEDRAPCPQCETDFAIYDPNYEDDGVWEEEVTALQHMLKAFNWTYRAVDHNDLNIGVLGSGADRRFRALIAPGGWSWYREAAVTPQGENKIREFLKLGGHYVGFCAGAYWAAKRIVWAQEASGAKQQYSTPGDYSGVYPYDLALYSGDAKGPLGWMPWRGGTNVNFSSATIDLKNVTMKKIGMPAEARFLYGGGPFFPGAEQVPGMEVWARANATGEQLSAETGAGQPTIIRYPVGKGSVTLFSYHPDVLIKHQADGIALKQFFDENGITWDLGGESFDQINLQSWNVVHAALQLAADQPVTPLTRIP